MRFLFLTHSQKLINENTNINLINFKNIIKLRNKANFVKITKAGFYESMVTESVKTN